jgi:SAM-dependent methyltransferase
MRQETRDTYNQSADRLSRHYDQMGSRDGDIDLAFILAGNPRNARVLELGCGNGRDAQAILKYTNQYMGIDSSEKMIAIARSKLPEGNFEVAEATDYEYAGPYDIVFAFALFRHLSIEEVTVVLKKAAAALRQGGVFYISSMHDESYQEISRDDTFGTREMYLYNPRIIMKRCPPSLKKVQEIYDHINGKEWFELALIKQA